MLHVPLLMVAVPVGAIFSSSVFMNVSTTGALSVAAGVVLLEFPAGQRVEALVVLVLLAGVIQLLAGLFRLGFLIRFVSHSVMTGFLNGVAVLIECLTDNRNRAAGEVRVSMTRNGGNMADPGSVAYLFSRKGVVLLAKNGLSEDDVLLAVLEADVGHSWRVSGLTAELTGPQHITVYWKDPPVLGRELNILWTLWCD